MGLHRGRRDQHVLGLLERAAAVVRLAERGQREADGLAAALEVRRRALREVAVERERVGPATAGSPSAAARALDVLAVGEPLLGAAPRGVERHRHRDPLARLLDDLEHPLGREPRLRRAEVEVEGAGLSRG